MDIYRFLSALPAILAVVGLTVFLLLRHRRKGTEITKQIVEKLRKDSPVDAEKYRALKPGQLRKRLDSDQKLRDLVSKQDAHLLERTLLHELILSLVVYAIIALLVVVGIRQFANMQTKPTPLSLVGWNLQIDDRAAMGLDHVLTWKSTGPAEDLEVWLENLETKKVSQSLHTSTSEQSLRIPHNICIEILGTGERGVSRVRAVAKSTNGIAKSQEFELSSGLTARYSTNAFPLIRRTSDIYETPTSYWDHASFSLDPIVTGDVKFYFIKPDRLHVVLDATSLLLQTANKSVTVKLWALSNSVTIYIKELNEYKQWTNVNTLDLDQWNPQSDLLKGFIRAIFPAYRFVLRSSENTFAEKVRPRNQANVNKITGECDISWEEDIYGAVGGKRPTETPDYRIVTSIRTDARGVVNNSVSDLRDALGFLSENKRLDEIPELRWAVTLLLQPRKGECVVTHTNCVFDSPIEPGMFKFVPSEDLQRVLAPTNFSIRKLFTPSKQ